MNRDDVGNTNECFVLNTMQDETSDSSKYIIINKVFQLNNKEPNSVQNYDVGPDNSTMKLINEAIIEEYELTINKLCYKFKNQLIRSIKNDEFELGEISSSSIIFSDMMRQNENVAKRAINEVFLDCFHDDNVVYGVLEIISDIEYDVIYPNGQTIALAVSAYSDDRIKEALVRAFENWCNVESLRILNTIKFTSSWLESYRLDVIKDIEEFCDCAI